MILESPNNVSLVFLFQEIWLDEIYNYSGYTISPGDTVIDIGANIGAFSVYAATHSSNVRVYAYEPFPENIAWLELNLKNNKITNVKIFPQAVAGLSSTRILKVCSSWVGHSLTPEGAASEGIPVSCITLEDIFKSNNLQKCDLLKIDCEGSEYEILQNSTPETLKKVKKMVCEYHLDSNGKATIESLCDFLQNRSFRIDQVKPLGSDTGILFAQQVY
jgi:FkbM family methyltransferase